MRKNLTRKERELRRWDAVLDCLTALLAIGAVLLLAGALAHVGEAKTAAYAKTPMATVQISADSISVAPFPEDPNEQHLIDAALVDDGYYSDLIPLSYDLQDTLQWACAVNDVPYCVALGLIEHESRFNTEAVSRVGCYGLCQLNPKYFPSGLDPHENIVTGMTYLGRLIRDHNGDLPAALRAYNRGHDDGARKYSNTVLAYAEAWRLVLDKEAMK